LTDQFPVTGSIVDVCFANGDYADLLVVGSEASNKRGEVRIWDTMTGTLLNSIYDPRGMITSVATTTSSWVASASKYMLRLFDIRSPNDSISLFKTGQMDVNIVSFSPCERYIQSSATDNRCVVFDVRFPERPIHLLSHLPPIGQHEASGLVGINTAVWSPDGTFLVTGGEDGFVRIWDISSGDPLINCLMSNSPICGCDVSNNYDMIVAGDEAATIKVWSTPYSNYILDDEDLTMINPILPRNLQDANDNNINVEATIAANIAALAARLDQQDQAGEGGPMQPVGDVDQSDHMMIISQQNFELPSPIMDEENSEEISENDSCEDEYEIQ